MACPRCRGTFEGSPDACPHCGLTKAEAAQLNSQATITAPLAPPAPQPQTQPQPAPQAQPVASAPISLPGEPEAPAVSAEDGEPGPKGRRWLLALPVVVILLAAGFWWMTQGKDGASDAPAQGDCSSYREELLEARSREYDNSREQRRALGEVIREARDAGCDADDLESNT